MHFEQKHDASSKPCGECDRFLLNKFLLEVWAGPAWGNCDEEVYVLYVVTASLTLRMWLKRMCHLRWLQDSSLALFTVFVLPGGFKINICVRRRSEGAFLLFKRLLQQCIGEIPWTTGFNFLPVLSHCRNAVLYILFKTLMDAFFILTFIH